MNPKNLKNLKILQISLYRSSSGSGNGNKGNGKAGVRHEPETKNI